MIKKKIFLVSSSHMDREWYYSFEKFRIQICQIIDRVLELFSKYPEYRCFMLDGQTCVLEDYLEIYPYKGVEIKEYIKSGRLIVGPWYIQPDEFLPCGESHIRNLILGHRISSFYGKTMNLGYVPDSFGHISQMPQILNGFGMERAFFMRGVDMKFDREFIWEAPDGSRVLAVLQEYGNCSNMDFNNMMDGMRIIDDYEDFKERVQKITESREPTPTTPNSLAMYCGDHAAPALNIVDMVNRFNSEAKDFYIEIASLESYFNAVADCNPCLKTLKGELRESFDISVLKDTLGSRIYLKTENHLAQKLLLDYAEPVNALAWCEGAIYPAGFIDMAWKYLLLNHTHDGICGCSMDDVHDEMMVRFRKCEDISERLIATGFKYIIDRIDTSAIGNDDKVLVIFNPISFERGECVEVDICFKGKEKPDNISLYDMEGREILHQVIYKTEREKIETDIDVVQRFYTETVFRVIFNSGSISALGYKSFKVVPKCRATSLVTREPRYESGLKCGFNSMENEFLSVMVKSDGTLDITDKENNITYPGLHYFEDTGDAGDVYTYVKPELDTIFDSRNLKWDISLIINGPIMVKYRLEARLPLPVSLTPNKVSRSNIISDNIIQCDVALTASSRYIGITTIIVNNSQDHRLRVMFPSRIETDCTYSEGHYSVEKRGVEQYPYLHPQQTFIDINDEKMGFAIFNKGIPQYEVLRDGLNTVALTLLKCQDTLYRLFFSTCNEDFKGAQCMGRHVFEYAIYPHRGNHLKGKVLEKAHEFSKGIYSMVTGKHTGSLPHKFGYLSIEPEELVVTAVKRSEDGRSLIVRFYNITGSDVEGKLVFNKESKSAKRLNLNEEFIEDLPSRGNSAALSVKGHEIMTVALEI